jgi:uncharacterized protein (DUF2384 family)
MTGIAQPPNPAADDRAARAVRASIRAFLDGVKAADWLVTPNPEFNGRSPLSVAKDSEDGCTRVLAMLAPLSESERAPD